MPELAPTRLIEADFWQLPLDERMAEFAVLREQGAFLPIDYRQPRQ